MFATSRSLNLFVSVFVRTLIGVLHRRIGQLETSWLGLGMAYSSANAMPVTLRDSYGIFTLSLGRGKLARLSNFPASKGLLWDGNLAHGWKLSSEFHWRNPTFHQFHDQRSVNFNVRIHLGSSHQYATRFEVLASFESMIHSAELFSRTHEPFFLLTCANNSPDRITQMVDVISICVNDLWIWWWFCIHSQRSIQCLGSTL